MVKVSFFFIIISFLGAFNAFSQEIEGITFDKDSRYRINRVNITNLRTKESIFNDIKGEFKINAKSGDQIVAVLIGYHPDTLSYKDQTALIFYLQRKAIPLREVWVQDSILSARKKYEELKKDYQSLNRLGNQDFLLKNSGGIGIDAIWNSFSREGKNARRLTEVLERDYQNNYIDEHFNKQIVKKVTDLKEGEKLEIFMLKYRPSYYFLIGANDFDLASYIKMAYVRFNKDPYYEDVSLLKPIEP
jgi:hypothetical protein